MPLARKDLIDEDSGAWETVAIPVDSGTPYRFVTLSEHFLPSRYKLVCGSYTVDTICQMNFSHEGKFNLEKTRVSRGKL